MKLLRAAGFSAGWAGGALAAQIGPQLQPLQRELLRWQRLAAVPNRTLAYCFCGID